MWHQQECRIYGWQSAECSYILMTACIAVTDPNTSSVNHGGQSPPEF